MRSLAATLLFASLLAAPAAAGDVAPVATHEVVTAARTLRGLPLKRVIATRAGWDRVLDGVDAPPPAPDFARHQVLLVVADEAGGARSRLDGLRLRDDGALSVVLHREEPASADPDARASLRAYLLVLPLWPGGVHVEHRTHLAGGGGSIARPMPPSDLDRDPERLPSLGPDLRLSWVLPDGTPLPAGAAVQLRREAHYKRSDLPARVHTEPFPRALGAAFPRFRDEVSYVWAAHATGLRSRNALRLRALPPDGPDGSPRPITHRFVLEPVHGPPGPPPPPDPSPPGQQ